MENERRWYVVHVYSGYEKKVKANLEMRIQTTGMQEKIFNVMIPEEEGLEYRNGEKKMTTRKVYPGYILVEMIMTDDSWYVVRNTQGVTGFVGSGTKPIPLEPHEVEKIKKLTGPRVGITLYTGKVGDYVRVIDGNFTDFEAKVMEIDNEKGRLKVLIPIFGRDTIVDLGLDQVQQLD